MNTASVQVRVLPSPQIKLMIMSYTTSKRKYMALIKQQLTDVAKKARRQNPYRDFYELSNKGIVFTLSVMREGEGVIRYQRGDEVIEFKIKLWK